MEKSETKNGKGKKFHGCIRPRKYEWELYARWLAFDVEGRRQLAGDKVAKLNGAQFKGTDQDFAKIYHVSDTALTKWKRDPEMWKVRDAFMYPELRKMTRPVLNGLTRTAISQGRASEVNAFMKIVEQVDTDAPQGPTEIRVVIERRKPEGGKGDA